MPLFICIESTRNRCKLKINRYPFWVAVLLISKSPEFNRGFILILFAVELEIGFFVFIEKPKRVKHGNDGKGYCAYKR